MISVSNGRIGLNTSRRAALARIRTLVLYCARKPIAASGAFVFLNCVVLSVFADVFSVHDTRDIAQINLYDILLPPGADSNNTDRSYILGTDSMGRDLWSACLYGLRLSLIVGLIATIISAVLGSILGLISAVGRGWMDATIMRVTDTMLSFPAILIALILLGFFGRGIEKTILALVLAQWAVFARTMRASAMVELAKPYVQSAQVLGLSKMRIVLFHVLPNSMAPLVVIATVQLSSAISLEAALSFLGVGLPPNEQSLGILINEGRTYLLSGKSWLALFPGLFLIALILSINLLGDELRDRFNPRSAS